LLHGFTFLDEVGHNNFSRWILGGFRISLKLRGLLLLLLFAHVMLHPWVHAVGAKAVFSDHASLSADSPATSLLVTSDQCELCRVGHNATAAPQLPQVERLNPGWILTAFHAVNYASLQADQRRPSRAPPLL
jgi:hypothetical protein